MTGVARMIQPVHVGEHVVAQSGDDRLEWLRVERDRLVEPFGDLVRRAPGAHRALALARIGEGLRRERSEVRRGLPRAIAVEGRERVDVLSVHIGKIAPASYCRR